MEKIKEVMELVDAYAHHERMQDAEASAQCREFVESKLRELLSAPVVPQFSQVAKQKLNYLLEGGEEITGYAIQNKDGRRGAIDCHGFVYWWQDAAAPQPPEADSNSHEFDGIKPEAAPAQLPEPVAAESRFFAGDRWRWCPVEYARAFGADKGYEVRCLYTEQQVRALLAEQAKKDGAA